MNLTVPKVRGVPYLAGLRGKQTEGKTEDEGTDHSDKITVNSGLH